MKDGKIIYLDGKVLVNDFKKDSKNPVELIELKEYEYQDNIKELIKQENIVEQLEKYKDSIIKRIEINNNLKNSNLRMIKNLRWISIVMFIVGSIILSFVGFSIPNAGLIRKILFGPVSSASVVTLYTGYFMLICKRQNKNAEKSINGLKLELKELEKEIEKNKEILKELQNNKSKENEQQSMSKKIEDIHYIHLNEYRKIKNKLLLYREIGENENKFSKYYNKGILEEKLNETYELEEIKKIKTYFKSKK